MMAKNMVVVKPPKMTGGAAGGTGRLEKSAAAPGNGSIKVKTK